jgi:phage terminase small subunit
MIKKCLACGKKKEMRSNQKYCDDKCKKRFENYKYNGKPKTTPKVPKSALKPPLNLPPAGVPACPAYLNEIAAGYWQKIAPTVIERGHLNVLSEDAFAEMCDLYSRLRDTNQAIDAENRSLLQIDIQWDSRTGKEIESFKESQLSKNKRLYSKLYADYCDRFYLTPKSNRGNFGLEDKEEVDPHDAFLNMGSK